MDYILVTNDNVQSVFAQGGSFLYDFQTDVTYFGDLILPANSILRFSGGVLSVTGNITGNHTVINAPSIATQIMILGGAYWFDVNYTIIEEELVDYNIECYDRVSVIRYNRSMVDLGYVFDEFLTPFTKHNQLY